MSWTERQRLKRGSAADHAYGRYGCRYAPEHKAADTSRGEIHVIPDVHVIVLDGSRDWVRYEWPHRRTNYVRAYADSDYEQ
jgi:hypothetical protein